MIDYSAPVDADIFKGEDKLKCDEVLDGFFPSGGSHLSTRANKTNDIMVPLKMGGIRIRDFDI